MRKIDRKAMLAVLLVATVGVSALVWRTSSNKTPGSDSTNKVSPTSQPPSPKSTNSTVVAQINLQEQELIVPTQFRSGVFSSARVLTLPESMQIKVFAAGMNAPRFMDFDDQGTLFVTDIDAGIVYAINDTDNNDVADGNIVVDRNLRKPHGIEYFEGDLYVAEEDEVNVYRSIETSGKYRSKETIIRNLPAGAGHSSRTIIIGPDRKIYLSIGSSCNVCEEKDRKRAAVVRYNLDGTGEEIFAEGLRNSVGILFHQGQLWSVDNGRDRIGDDLPPEEVNLITQGKHYGWPYCYGDRQTNPEYPQRADYCKNQTNPPRHEMQAHSAPLGFTFVPDTSILPAEAKNKMLIAFHGSWNRSVPTGYKIVLLDTSTQNSREQDFITGWLPNDGRDWGRPVDVKFSPSGKLFITDDETGAIYLFTMK